MYRRHNYRGRKRRRTDDKDYVDRAGGDQQLVKLTSASVGERLSKEARAAKLLLSNLISLTERWQDLSPPSATALFRELSYTSVNTDETNITTFPFYIWDLTQLQSCMNGGVASYGFPAQRLYRRAGAPASDPYTYYFENISTRNQSDTGDTKTWITQTFLSNPELAYAPKQMIRGATIDMMIMGATSRPSRATVEVWQFTDPLFVPCGFAGTTANAASAALETLPTDLSGDDQQTYNIFWQQQSDDMANNPLIKRGTTSKPVKGHKVLYSKEFEFNPESSADLDSRGQTVQWSLNVNLDKVCDYHENGVYQPTTNVNFDNVDVYDADQQLSAGMQTITHKLGRVYLVVKGFTFGEGVSASTNASFDIMIRRKRQLLLGVNDV